MRVLLIKTSSMGDIIHTLPALTDASRAIPHMTFDWVVEEPFADIPGWHQAVDKIIPVALRRWRKGIFSKESRTGWRQLRKQLHEQKYDLILDAQGLVKSALLTFLASGVRAGLDFGSARESLASFAYQRKLNVNFYQHAILRQRHLFSLALGYPMPETLPDYGLTHQAFSSPTPDENYLVFLFGTTWGSKHWPESYWSELAKLAEIAGYRVKISGYSTEEMEQAARIGKGCAVDILPRMDIKAMAGLLANAKAVVAVDTGFAHLAAALDVPTVSIYGSTNPAYTGAQGKFSRHLAADFPCSPCFNRKCTYRKASPVTPACYTTVSPARVWGSVKDLVSVHGGQEKGFIFRD
jgi:heptosyltransferase-1